MNIEPCVRLGMRISPKISEKPADSRNNRPPNVTLLTVNSSQKFMTVVLDLVARMERSVIRGLPERPLPDSLRSIRAIWLDHPPQPVSGRPLRAAAVGGRRRHDFSTC